MEQRARDIERPGLIERFFVSDPAPRGRAAPRIPGAAFGNGRSRAGGRAYPDGGTE